ncbi:MAG: N-acetyltransferase family protein [Candidatus Kariarchaeaceae archaeon]|jgi:RimJ/RimL family protein N-acetyltransferase
MKQLRLGNGQLLTIREAEVPDAQTVLDFIVYIARESDNVTFGPGEFSMTVEEEERYFERIQSLPRNIIILGFIDDEQVAMADITSRPRPRLKHLGELGISVRKDFWRMGIGQEMMQYLIEWARDVGLRKINLEVRSDHQGGIALYRKMGFVDEGMGTRTMFIKGQFVDTLRMGLQID